MTAPPTARHRFRLFAAVALLTLSAGLVGFAAQPPEEEEESPKAAKKQPTEEEGKGGVKKKIVIDDGDGPSPKAAGGGSKPDVRLDEVAKAAEGAPAGLKEVYTRFSVPFDQITLAKGGTLRVKPLKPYRTEPGYKTSPFQATELTSAGLAGEVHDLNGAEVRQIEHFEELAVAEADKLLRDQTTAAGVTADARAAAAERILAGAVRYHDYARANKGRDGKLWDPVKAPLVAKLKDARVARLQRAVAAQDWVRAMEAGNVLIDNHPKDPAVGREVAAARVAAAGPLVRSGNHADRARARELLDALEQAFPGAGGDEVRKLRQLLTGAAQQLYDRAVGYQAQGNMVSARDDAARAAELDPTIPGLRELQLKLGNSSPVLYVGARPFPERLSPATARLDAERQVVELLFAGLLEEVPVAAKDGGVRYVPAAAQGPPLVVPGGRDVFLRQYAKSADAEGFDTADVVATVKLLRGKPDAWVSAGLPWLDDLPRPAGGGGLTVAFRHGHPDPRALLTFKLLPGRWLADKGMAVDSIDFATKPVGTGVYQLRSVSEAGAGTPRELVLTDNKNYGKSPGRAGLPYIREIRVVEAAKMSDPLAEFKAGRLHILPDLTKEEMEQVRRGFRTEFKGKAQVVTAETNRRVHVLAVNHRRPPLQNRNLRQGLNRVLDREAVVREVYRFAPPDLQRYGLAMSGPFPPQSWATVKGSDGRPISLYNRATGVELLQEYLKSPGAVAKYTLLYPADDALAAAACNKLAQQIAGLALTTPDGQTLTLTPTPTGRRQLIQQVEEEGRYDLAYVPFEYPDDWYPFGLAAFLDPAAAGRGGRNWTGFGSSQGNPQKEDRVLVSELAGLLEHRDFEKELLPRAHRIHNAFNECVPFIPLWHADRHMLVHTGVKVFLDDGPDPAPAKYLNQSTLFQNVARWRLEP